MKSFSRLRISAVAFAVGVASSPAVWSDTQDDLQQLKQQVEELNQKIQALEQQQEIDKENVAAKAKETSTANHDDNKINTFQSDDGTETLHVGGYVQADSRWYSGNQPAIAPGTATSAAATGGVDTFLIRRARLQFSGTIGNYFDYWLEPSFDDGAAGLQGAYLDADLSNLFKVRVGKFKVPLGLERLQFSSNNSFVETAFTTGLTPNYEVGAELFGTVFSGTTDYQVAVINGSALENVNINNNSSSSDADINDAKDIATRVFARPLQNTNIDVLKKLGVGIAYLHGNEPGVFTYNAVGLPTAVPVTNLGTYRTPGQETFFSYNTNVYAVGTRDRITPQADWYYGPFGLLAEYVKSSQNVARYISTTNAQANLQSVDNDAWQVLASWVITGEDATYGSGTSYPGTVIPKHPFDWRNGYWGAFEVVARYNEQDNDSDVFLAPGATKAVPVAALQLANPATAAQQARDIGLGLNWYFNRQVKLETDYDVTNFNGGGGTLGTTILDRPQEKVLFTRVQFAY